MALDEYDTIISEMLEEMTELLNAGLDDQRKGEEFSTEERFIILARRVNEMARSRPDTKPIPRVVNGKTRTVAMRELVFDERKERHEKEAPQRTARLAALKERGP